VSTYTIIHSPLTSLRRKDPHFRFVGQAVNAEKHNLVYNRDIIEAFIRKVQGQLEPQAETKAVDWSVAETEEDESDEEQEGSSKPIKAKKLGLADELKLIESMAEYHKLPPGMKVTNFDSVAETHSDLWDQCLRGIYGNGVTINNDSNFVAYGFEAPSEVQSTVVPLCVRTNRDCLVIAPSGTGKTAGTFIKDLFLAYIT
jgi:hypothetical protein